MSSKRSTQNSTDSEPYLITEFLDPKLRSSTESGSSTDLKDSITYVKFDTHPSSASTGLVGIVNKSGLMGKWGMSIEVNHGQTDIASAIPGICNLPTISKGVKQTNATTEIWPEFCPVLPHQIAIRDFLKPKYAAPGNEQRQSLPTRDIGDSGSYANGDSYRDNSEEQFHLNDNEQYMLKHHAPQKDEPFPYFSHLNSQMRHLSPLSDVESSYCFDTIPANNLPGRNELESVPRMAHISDAFLAKKNKPVGRCFFLFLSILLISAVIGVIEHYRRTIIYGDDPPLLPGITTPERFLSNCDLDGTTGQLGKEMCCAPSVSSCPAIYNMKHKVLSTITIHQISSLYYSFTRKQDDVVITLSNFNSDFKGWIVDYNESREDQPLRLGKSELTCFDIGWYEVILHYETGFDDSCPFGINNSNPKVDLSINDTEDFFHITCNMSNVCFEALLAISINDGNTSLPVRSDNKNCRNGTSLTKQVAVLKSAAVSYYHKVSCNPLSDATDVIENLMITSSLCTGIQTKVKLLINESQDLFIVTCEMTDTCFIGSLAILINNGNSDLSVLSEENTYTNGTSMSKQVSILKSSAITVDHEVTCKPITDDTDLTERLTRTTPLCKGIQCSTSCKEEHKGYYFQHPVFCNRYYQCEHPALHLRPCPENQQWGHENCTCIHTSGGTNKCNSETKMYYPPLVDPKIKKCGGALR